MSLPPVSLLLKEKDYFEIAAIAAQHSLDPSTQNGAVIADGDGNISVGWNRFARGLSVTDSRLADRDMKLRMTVHAEEAAIIAAHASVADFSTSTMFCLWAACTKCALAIIEARIPRLITLEGYYAMSPERWRGDIDAATEMLEEAGVLVTRAKFNLPQAARGLRFNGEPVESQFPIYE